MTEEIIKFKCPSCQRFLLEDEYYDACEEIRILANQKAKQILKVHISELEIEDRKLVKKIKERLVSESEVSESCTRRGK